MQHRQQRSISTNEYKTITSAFFYSKQSKRINGNRVRSSRLECSSHLSALSANTITRGSIIVITRYLLSLLILLLYFIYAHIISRIGWIGWRLTNDFPHFRFLCVPPPNMRLVGILLIFGGISFDSHALKPLKTRTVDVGDLKLSTIGAGTWSWGNRSEPYISFNSIYILALHTCENTLMFNSSLI